MIPALKIENLSKVYGNDFEALKGISLEVEQGDFFALLGPNGAGKSTTIGIVCSLVSKSGGSVHVHGVDIDEDFPAAKKFIGIVPQEFNFNQFEKVEDIVTTQAGYYGIPLRTAKVSAEKYLKKLGLWDKRHTPARMLSGGRSPGTGFRVLAQKPLELARLPLVPNTKTNIKLHFRLAPRTYPGLHDHQR